VAWTTLCVPAARLLKAATNAATTRHQPTVAGAYAGAGYLRHSKLTAQLTRVGCASISSSHVFKPSMLSVTRLTGQPNGAERYDPERGS